VAKGKTCCSNKRKTENGIKLSSKIDLRKGGGSDSAEEVTLGGVHRGETNEGSDGFRGLWKKKTTLKTIQEKGTRKALEIFAQRGGVMSQYPGRGGLIKGKGVRRKKSLRTN